jgi:FkbM family methyltransferase
MKRTLNNAAVRLALTSRFGTGVARWLTRHALDTPLGRLAEAFSINTSRLAPYGTARVAQLGDYRLIVDLANASGAQQYFLGRSDVFPILRKVVGPGDVCVDVGANYGDFTCFFASRVGPTGKVVSYEPHPRIGDVVARSVALNDFGSTVNLRRFAVSDTPGGQVPFYIGNDKGNQGLSSLVPPSGRSWAQAEKSFEQAPVLVSTVTLDQDLAGLGIDRVTVLKIDVEGADTATVRGAASLIREKRVGVVVVEANGDNRPDRLLAEYGMSCSRLAPGGASLVAYDIAAPLGYSDVVAVHRGTDLGERLMALVVQPPAPQS